MSKLVTQVGQTSKKRVPTECFHLLVWLPPPVLPLSCQLGENCMFLPLSFHELKGVEKRPGSSRSPGGWLWLVSQAHGSVSASLLHLPWCFCSPGSVASSRLPPQIAPRPGIPPSCGCPQLAFPSPPFLLPQPYAWQMVPAPTPLLSQEPGLLASSLPYSSSSPHFSTSSSSFFIIRIWDSVVRGWVN